MPTEPKPTADEPTTSEPSPSEPTTSEPTTDAPTTDAPTVAAPGPVPPPPALDEDQLFVVEEVVEAEWSLDDAGYGPLTRLAAETFGSFALVLITVGTLLYSAATGLNTLGSSLAAGLTLAGLYAAFVHVSGAHLNPAITLASAIAGRVRAADAALYVVGQVLGGAMAAAVLIATVPSGLPALVGADGAAAFLGSVANGWDDGSPLSALTQGQATFGVLAALLVETLGTAVLAAVVLGARPLARSAVAVGGTFAAVLMLAGPVTAGGLNPARSTAVALFTIGSESPALGQLWLFWVAPLVGAAIAGIAKLAMSKREQAPLL